MLGIKMWSPCESGRRHDRGLEAVCSMPIDLSSLLLTPYYCEAVRKGEKMKMKKRLAVAVGLGLLALCSVSQSQAQTTVTLPSVTPAAGQKPNIILIVSDDFGYGDAGAYGGGVGRGMPTPNIDRMTAEGMMFYSFYGQP